MSGAGDRIPQCVMYCGTFPYSIKSTRHGGLFFVTKTLQGTVHGRTIELDDDVGAPEGQEVRVHVTFLPPAGNWGEGILSLREGGQIIPKWTRSWRKSTSREGGAPAANGESMSHLLDTNICAAHFRRPAGLAH